MVAIIGRGGQREQNRLLIECPVQDSHPEICHRVVCLVYENECGASKRGR